MEIVEELRLNKQTVVKSLKSELMLRCEHSPAECCRSDWKLCSWCSNWNRRTTLEVDDIFSAAGARLFKQKYVQEILRAWIVLPSTVRHEVWLIKGWMFNRWSCFVNLKRNDIIVQDREQICCKKKQQIRSKSAVKTQYSVSGAPANKCSPLWKYSISWANTGPVFIEVPKRLFTLPV